MKAMVLAAGLGTRLRPLTDERPKALVEVGGRTMLELALARLRRFGVGQVVVNAHHHAQMIVDYLVANGNFGMRIEVSREDLLLDTGGGLKQAARFFLEDGAESDEPFILHNVDVLSTIDLGCMVSAHRAAGALATLAVQQRDSSRLLLFDAEGLLCGRRRRRDGETEWARRVEGATPLAFAGIHVISPPLFPLLEEQGAFSIVDAYLRLAARGEKIAAFRADGAYWRDLGRPESVAQASLDLQNGVCPQP
ncbi:MAG: nucleotidyltransferase family protein [Terracidiphilus sp.]